jgi:(p)ppGpp synthase/HD superfamily hydrolase
MVTYTNRFDKALRRSAQAHEQSGHHRKGTDIPYITHPFGVALIAGMATDDEDTLIACLLHDTLEDVRPEIYNEDDIRRDFGGRVLSIVKDVTKDDSLTSWRDRSEAYLAHLRDEASSEAIIVSASDKIHNLKSILIDYETVGDELWQRFTTKSKADQVWWYQSILETIIARNAPKPLVEELARAVDALLDLESAK